jgi:hypothetical protein
MCIFLGQKKYGIWGDFSEKFQVLCKNPDEVTRFDGTFTQVRCFIRKKEVLRLPDPGSGAFLTPKSRNRNGKNVRIKDEHPR